jgi:hypothetical protein
MPTIFPIRNDDGDWNDPVYEDDDANGCGTIIHVTGTNNPGSGMGLPHVKVIVGNSYTGPPISAAAVIPGPIVTVFAAATQTRSLVGHPIMIYSVPQIVRLTYPASTANGGYFLDNYPANRTTFRLVRNVQNEIRFYVRDVDRKPVALDNTETLTINIVDLVTDLTIMTRDLTTIDASKGIYLLTTLPSEMDTWPTTNALRWSIMYNRVDGASVLLWTDRSYSPYSDCTVTEGPAPAQALSTTVLNVDMIIDAPNTFTSPLVGAFVHGYLGGMQTFAVAMTNYTGDIRIDASLETTPVNTLGSSDWFQVDLQSYVAKTGTAVLNEQGNYQWMRLVVLPDISNTGTVDTTIYKN